MVNKREKIKMYKASKSLTTLLKMNEDIQKGGSMKDVISDIAEIIKEQIGGMEEMYREILNGKTYITFLITDYQGYGVDLKINLDDKKFMLKKVNVNSIEEIVFDAEMLLEILFYLINDVGFEWVKKENKW